MNWGDQAFGIDGMFQELREQLNKAELLPRPFYLRLCVHTFVLGEDLNSWVSLESRLKQFPILPQITDPADPDYIEGEQFFIDERKGSVIAKSAPMLFDGEEPNVSALAPSKEFKGVSESVSVEPSGIMTNFFASEILVKVDSPLEEYFELLCRSFGRTFMRHCIEGLKNSYSGRMVEKRCVF